MIRGFKYLAILILIFGVGLGLLFKLSPSFKKSAQLKALDTISDVAVKRISENPDAKGSVAADFINIPIKAREISEGIWQATGVGNTHLITTASGDVLFDTGLATQVSKQIDVLNQAVPDLNVTHIIVSHSHADHQGGVKFWKKADTQIITHAEFEEEQRYLTELQDYFWGRNRTLFPFIPESPPRLGLIAYGGVKPTQTVQNGAPLQFTQGGVELEVHALPGAEGADNIVLWLPKKKILFSGDFFGPLFPQFPNIFTMRGEKIRKPAEYIKSLEQVIALQPEMIVPSHKDPITDKAVIMAGLLKMRDATRYVHDAVIEGMNAGQTVEQLMTEIRLPQELSLTQQHGKVSWAVKSIWEYYATWFHFDKTTELYGVTQDSIYEDITALAGADALTQRAQTYLEQSKPLKALHILNIILGAEPENQAALLARKSALEKLLINAETGDQNSYEIYWLRSRIRDTQAQLDAQ